MGICETRLGHFQIAQTLLDRAKRACVKAPGGGDESQEEKYEPAAASVLVALSELHSAQGEYEAAADCLERAWEIKDEELGSDHPQARATPLRVRRQSRALSHACSATWVQGLPTCGPGYRSR